MSHIQEYATVYEKCCEQCYLINLPKQYLTKVLLRFFIMLTASFFLTYQMFIIAAIFLWFYTGYSVFLFSRIWKIHCLSVAKLLIFVAITAVVSFFLGNILREFLIFIVFR